MEQINTYSDIICTKSFNSKTDTYCCDEDDAMFTILSAISSYGLDKEIIKVNVYMVCENACQITYFQMAIDQLKFKHRNIFKKMKFEYKTNNDVRKAQLTPREASDWLLQSDIHFILSHIHQKVVFRTHCLLNTQESLHSQFCKVKKGTS